MLVAVAQAKLVQDQYQELRWAHDDLSEADPMADGAEAGEEDEELYRLRAPHPAQPRRAVLRAAAAVCPECAPKFAHRGAGLWCRSVVSAGKRHGQLVKGAERAKARSQDLYERTALYNKAPAGFPSAARQQAQQAQ